MSKSQRKSGGAKKIGHNKLKCQRYRERMIRYQNKLKRWIKTNIAKNATESEKQKKILEFKDIQDKRKKK